jgi:23S rRNA (uracil1939-C5)-methyltransferase
VFLQASPAAEHLMIDLVTAAVGKAKAVADLFSGVGTFALPLSRRARILAIDNDAAALGALDKAARNRQGLKPIEIRTRDLMREPLARKELEPFDAVVFDPPRAGAEAQAAMLAKSAIATVVAVSCNPTTLARDAGILLDGGYELKEVTPIDQFLYSNHLEAVAVFRRPSKKNRG